MTVCASGLEMGFERMRAIMVLTGAVGGSEEAG